MAVEHRAVAIALERERPVGARRAIEGDEAPPDIVGLGRLFLATHVLDAEPSALVAPEADDEALNARVATVTVARALQILVHGDVCEHEVREYAGDNCP